MKQIVPDLGHSALIVWDMQKGIVSRTFNSAHVVRNINRLLDAAHHTNHFVVYGQHSFFPSGYRTKYMAYLLERRHSAGSRSGPDLTEGSEDWQMSEELRLTGPRPSDQEIQPLFLHGDDA